MKLSYGYPSKVCILIITAFVLISVSCDQINELINEHNKVIEIVDENLRDALEEALGKSDDEEIRIGDALLLITLDASSRGITDLRGLEYFVLLEELNLNDNPSLSDNDFLILYFLQELRTLSVTGNSNFTALTEAVLTANLPNLTTVSYD